MLRLPRAAARLLLASLAACSAELPPPSPVPSEAPPPVTSSAAPASVSCEAVAEAAGAVQRDAWEGEDERRAVPAPADPTDTCAVADSNLARRGPPR